MELLNCKVLHKTFGEGKVIEQTENCIKVRFAAKDIPFVYPDAFAGFICCKDPQQQSAVEAAIREKKAAKLQADEERLAASRRAAEAAANVTVKASGHQRKGNESNLAFKCNFCDGGCSESCIGFKAACSDEQIRYNIEVKHHKWCSNPQSSCYQYWNGTITREELDERNANDGFVCYEARMLNAWIAAAGEDLSETGESSQGRRIQDAASNSLAVLTTRNPDTDEDARYIFAVFITGQVAEGNDIYAGYVKAKDNYKIELTPEEAEQMPFWHYYKNTDGGIRWSQGLYRYLKDSVAARILADIVEIKSGEEKEHAQRVLAHFCELKGIDMQKIPAAKGAK